MRPFLTAEWRNLLILNFAVEPNLLEPHVPPGTELDEWNGRTYLSLVGFRFLKTRIGTWRVPLHQSFNEVNLRFYVRRQRGEECRRGAVFLREIVSKRMVAAVARIRYGEPYITLPMKHSLKDAGSELEPGCTLEYSWRYAGRWNTLLAKTKTPQQASRGGSEAQFITEHYWGYTARTSGTTEYSVQHVPWLVADAEEARLDCDVAGVFGTRFVEPLSQPPVSTFVAAGSPVAVSTGVRIA
jgi:uncharacterized protein YqjF (DUF2071 family)